MFKTIQRISEVVSNEEFSDKSTEEIHTLVQKAINAFRKYSTEYDIKKKSFSEGKLLSSIKNTIIRFDSEIVSFFKNREDNPFGKRFEKVLLEGKETQLLPRSVPGTEDISWATYSKILGVERHTAKKLLNSLSLGGLEWFSNYRKIKNSIKSTFKKDEINHIYTPLANAISRYEIEMNEELTFIQHFILIMDKYTNFNSVIHNS